MSNRFLWVVSFVRPCVNPMRRGMAHKIENFYNPFPNCFPFESFFYWHALNVRSFRAVQSADDVAQFLDITHPRKNSSSKACRRICHESRSLPFTTYRQSPQSLRPIFIANISLFSPSWTWITSPARMNVTAGG